MSSNWRPQQYRKLGQSIGADSTVLENAIAAGTAVLLSLRSNLIGHTGTEAATHPPFLTPPTTAPAP